MKSIMRKILTETDEAKFIELKNKYLQQLKDDNEDDFLKYLEG